MKKLALLILNFNGWQHLERCYQSLSNQTCNDFDVYLVDNDSIDDSRDYTRKYYSHVKIINTGGNLGYAGAYNFVFKYLDDHKVKYQYYILLNNDTECDKFLVEKLIELFEKQQDIDILVPAIVDDEMIIDSCGGRFLFATGTTLGWQNGQRFQRGNSLYKCFWASGSAMAIRTKVFKELGYFNNYFMYYEDVDFSWRVINSGHDVVATDETFVKHFQGGSNAASSFQMYYSERNRLLAYWQNLPNLIFIPYLPIFILLRLALIFHNVGDFASLGAKLRGLFWGACLLPRFKKKTHSLRAHISVIKNMNRIKEYAG